MEPRRLDEPNDAQELAATAVWGLGIILLFFGGMFFMGAIGGAPSRLEFSVLTATCFLPGLTYLICGAYVGEGKRWAIFTSLILCSVQVLVGCAVAIMLLMFSFVLVATGFIALVLASAWLILQLQCCLKSLRMERRGFEPLMVQPKPVETFDSIRLDPHATAPTQR